MGDKGTANKQRTLQRLTLADTFPADPNLAEAHYRAQWFAPEMFFRCPKCGTQFDNNYHICPRCNCNIEKEVFHCVCCKEKIKEVQYPLCLDDDSPALSPDIVVFLTFIKLILLDFTFRFLVMDLYTIYSNWNLNTCAKLNDWVNCPRTFMTRMATLRRVEDEHTFFLFDMLNLAFILISIIYLLCCENYLHIVFEKTANSIQTEDDFSVYVYNIPVLLDNEQSTNFTGYQEALTSYFEQVVRNWINERKIHPQKQQHHLFKDYVNVARKYGDDPWNPRRIVTSVNLCWDLEELVNLRRQKRRIMRQYTRKAGKSRAKQNNQYWGLDDETQRKLSAINQAEIEISDKFVDKNLLPQFAIGRFLGKAYVSFEYQHFSEAVIRSVRDTEIFQSFREIQVENAASPVDVHWGNLNLQGTERTERKVATFIITMGCIAIGFGFVLGLRYLFRSYFKVDDYDTNAGFLLMLGSFSVAVLIVVINQAVQWLIRLLTDYEEHETRTREEESELFKLLTASFVNIVLSTLVVWAFMPYGIWDRNGLAVQVLVIMVGVSLIEVLLNILNWRWVWRWLKLKFSHRPGEPILEFQVAYNEEYQLPEFDLAMKYNYYLWTAYFLAFFSYLVPASNIIGLIVLSLQYCIDRINLFRRSSFEPNYNFLLGRSAMRLFQTTIFVQALGNFISGWILKHTWYQPVNIISLMITILFVIFIWAIVGNKRHPCYYFSTVFEQFTYTDCVSQGKFYHSYQSMNPATHNATYGENEFRFYGLDASAMMNSSVMSPNPIISSLPQIGSQLVGSARRTSI